MSRALEHPDGSGGTAVIDKSLVANLLALLLVAVGYWWPAEPLFHAGVFALSGGLTNWLAVHMLFHRVPGLYGSGVIPLHFREFKVGIRRLVMQQFFSPATIARVSDVGMLSEERLNDMFRDLVERMDFDRAFDSLVEAILQSSLGNMLGMFGGGDALESLREPFRERMRLHLQGMLEQPAFNALLKEALREISDPDSIARFVERLVDQRLDELTPVMVRDIVQAMIRRHLGWLVVWGVVLGGLIGLLFSVLS
ncbi:MAG: hypothetical protein WEB57_07540 [Pseudohongiellaceae bacterium]